MPLKKIKMLFKMTDRENCDECYIKLFLIS